VKIVFAQSSSKMDLFTLD